jgi:hypothetical protein
MVMILAPVDGQRRYAESLAAPSVDPAASVL